MQKVNKYDLIDKTYVKNVYSKLEDKKDIKVLENLMTTGISTEDMDLSYPRLVRIPKSNGKLRDIYIYPEKSKILQKIITEAVVDKFGDEINTNVYSYQKNKRIFNAVSQLKEDLTSNTYLIKADISDYFKSISQKHINKMIDDYFEPDELGKAIYNMFNSNKYEYSGRIYKDKLGIMPGSSLSCPLSNLALKEIDYQMEKITDTYIRYSDDIVIGCSTKEKAIKAFKHLEYRLKVLELEINPEKVDYYSNQNIEFLGLDINIERIDITNDKFKNIKRDIKIKCKKYRKEIELGKISKEKAIERLVYSFNNYMYFTALRNIEHIGLGGFILNNVTTFETLQQIDFYLLNKCRYLITGKNNKSNCNVLQFKDIEQYGFRSMCELYKLNRIDKDVYLNEIYLMKNKSQ